MYLFLLHQNNIRSIQSCNIKSYGFTPRNYHGRKHILVNWTGNDDSNMHVVSMAMMQQVVRGSWVWGMGGSLLHSLHSKVTKNGHGTFLIPTLGIQNLIFIFRTPSGILLDPRMIFMDLASVWDEAWLSLPELWMFSSRIPDSWNFREVRRFESSWWAVNSVWLFFLNWYYAK